MRYKVGDKGRVKSWEELDDKYEKNIRGNLVITGNCAYTEGMREFCKGSYKITNVDQDGDYFLDKCGSCVFPGNVLEPLNSHLTFQQKLDRFKREPIGFLVKSKEIADELAKVFTREGMKAYVSTSASEVMAAAWDSYGKEGKLYVSCNYPGGRYSLSYGLLNSTGEDLDELLDITLEELKDYNAPQELEDKLKLFKAGTHVLHTPTQEIYDKLMVELEKRGYVWRSGDKPTFNHKEWESFSSGTCICYRSGKMCKASNSFYKETGLKILTLTTENFTIPQVITIITDGYRRTTAESNGVTAEALCNPTDKFSIHEGSHMALKRLLEKLDEDTIEELGDLSGEPEELHAGDIVEVVWCHYSFADRVKGIQGVVVNTGDNWCRIKFPVKFHDDVEWSFTNEQLKLVRKYNA